MEIINILASYMAMVYARGRVVGGGGVSPGLYKTCQTGINLEWWIMWKLTKTFFEIVGCFRQKQIWSKSTSDQMKTLSNVYKNAETSS